MGLVESLEALVPSEVDESQFREERRDRLYDYEHVERPDEDSGEAQRARGIIRFHEHFAPGYGTLSNASTVVEKLRDAEAFGSLHRVRVGEGIPQLCLRYAIGERSLRAANKALTSRCAVDDTDLGDLATVVIPRPIIAVPKGKPGPPATAQRGPPVVDAETALFWEETLASVCAAGSSRPTSPTSSGSGAAGADDLTPSPSASTPRTAAYTDRYVSVWDGQLLVRDLLSTAADGYLTAVIPCLHVREVSCVAAPSLNTSHVIPWAVGTDDMTGLVSVTLATDMLSFSDGSSARCVDVKQSGILLRVESLREFVGVMRRSLSASLP